MTENSIARILVGVKALLGKEGGKWSPVLADKKMSVIYAVGYSAGLQKYYMGSEEFEIILTYLNNILHDLGYPLPSFSYVETLPTTTWSNIQEILDLAIERLK